MNIVTAPDLVKLSVPKPDAILPATGAGGT
jgi:hypothetical protein